MEKAVLDTLLHTYPELAEKIHVSSEPVTTQTFYFAMSPATQNRHAPPAPAHHKKPSETDHSTDQFQCALTDCAAKALMC
tara:strand:- start:135 stop:374 length:240 start_codon:yes stop_codon:yes gene_type:complete